MSAGSPLVESHGLPSTAGPGGLPEVLSVRLTALRDPIVRLMTEGLSG
jgi:hypothetical protein